MNDLSWVKDDITIIYMYLLPQIFRNAQTFLSTLESLVQKGKTIVCYHYPIPNWTPSEVENTFQIYLYYKQ